MVDPKAGRSISWDDVDKLLRSTAKARKVFAALLNREERALALWRSGKEIRWCETCGKRPVVVSLAFAELCSDCTLNALVEDSGSDD